MIPSSLYNGQFQAKTWHPLEKYFCFFSDGSYNLADAGKRKTGAVCIFLLATSFTDAEHLSGGERSMLSGFQEAAQKVQDKDENALVPFHLFYDTVHTFLESAIRRVIDRCQTAADNHDGLEQQDVSVLKLLYLVRYIEDVKANIDNISILMIDDIRTDKIALRASVTASLERLLSQNYISRNGDTYAFLTDEEQDIAIDIIDTNISTAIWSCMGYTVLLCFTLFKTGSLAKSVFNAH